MTSPRPLRPLSVTMLFLAMTSLLLPPVTAYSGVKIAAFNVKTFGKTKVGKPEVVAILVKIIQRYDIVVIQEIRDIAKTAIVQLLNETNEAGPYQYSMVQSERLGRTSYKEQYAFFYRSMDGVNLLGTYQYPDDDDVFAREPYSAHFELEHSAFSSLILMVLHAAPDDVPDELGGLVPVFSKVKTHFQDDNLILLGDLNADCSYFNNAEKAASSLRNASYVWLLGDEADTTVSTSTDCAYDRFVVTSDFPTSDIVSGSPKKFDFEEEYKLSYDDAKDVSDHFPVELELGECHSAGVRKRSVRSLTEEEETGLLSHLLRALKIK